MKLDVLVAASPRRTLTGRVLHLMETNQLLGRRVLNRWLPDRSSMRSSW